MDINIREFVMRDIDTLKNLPSDDKLGNMVFSIAMSLQSYKYNKSIVRCYLAEDNGTVVGFIYGFVLPNYTLIPEFLYTIPEYRDQGIGTELLLHLEKVSGCSISQIYYDPSLHDFYKKQGYINKPLEVAVKPLDEETIRLFKEVLQ